MAYTLVRIKCNESSCGNNYKGYCDAYEIEMNGGVSMSACYTPRKNNRKEHDKSKHKKR